MVGKVIVMIIVIAVVADQVVAAFTQPVQISKIPPTPVLKTSDLIGSNSEIISQSAQRTISKVTDLAVGFSEENKMVYVIQRMDGKYEQFYLPANYTGDFRKLMGLKEGEKIITGFALVSVRSTPVIDKPEMKSTQIPIINNSYPAPLNQESSQLINNPYP